VFVGLASALGDGTLVMPTSQVAFAVVFGLTLGALTTNGVATAQPSTLNRTVGVVSAAVLVMATGLVAYQAFGTYREQSGEVAAFHQRFPGKWLTPRFWESGLRLIRASSISRH